MKLSFSGFCEELGVPLYNKAWAWCAHASEKQLALFTVWEDLIEHGQYIFPAQLHPKETRKNPGRTELISTLDSVIKNGWAAYGIQCYAADIEAIPRKRKSFLSEYLIDMRVRYENGNYIGRIVGHVPPQVILSRGDSAAWVSSTAINDVDQYEVANADPEYRRRMSGSYVRDNRVRAEVLKRAKGLCEFCGQAGFVKRDGNSYLETHHVIALSEQGADRLDNVIALCANDHRRAHFGRDWIMLQEQFLEKLKNYRTDY